MKLLHVSPYAQQDPSLGGVPQAVKSISYALSQSGHEVTIWASDEGSATPKASEAAERGVRTRLFRARLRVIGRALNSPVIPQLMLLDPGMIQEFDLVHLHGYWSSFTPSIALACRKAGLPLVLQPHGTLVNSGQKELAKTVFQLLFRRQVVAATRAIVALSDYERAQVQAAGFGTGLVRVVPNPLPTIEMSLPARAQARIALGLPLGSLIILYLGRLHPAKGLRELVRAYSIVRKVVPNALLVIAGPDEGMLSQLVRLKEDARLDGMIFLGPVVEPQKWLALRAADVMCLPSKYEGFPMTILEAAVVRTPCVISKAVALVGLTEGASYIASLPSPEPLAQALVDVLSDAGLRLRLSSNASEEANRNFNPIRIASRLQEVYEHALRVG